MLAVTSTSIHCFLWYCKRLSKTLILDLTSENSLVLRLICVPRYLYSVLLFCSWLFWLRFSSCFLLSFYSFWYSLHIWVGLNISIFFACLFNSTFFCLWAFFRIVSSLPSCLFVAFGFLSLRLVDERSLLITLHLAILPLEKGCRQSRNILKLPPLSNLVGDGVVWYNKVLFWASGAKVVSCGSSRVRKDK